MMLFGRSFMPFLLIFAILTTIPHTQYVHAAAPAVALPEAAVLAPAASGPAASPAPLSQAAKNGLFKILDSLEHLAKQPQNSEAARKAFNAVVFAVGKFIQISLQALGVVLRRLGKTATDPLFWVTVIANMKGLIFGIIILALIITYRKQIMKGLRAAQAGRKAEGSMLAWLIKITKEFITGTVAEGAAKGATKAAEATGDVAAAAVAAATGMEKDEVKRVAREAFEAWKRKVNQEINALKALYESVVRIGATIKALVDISLGGVTREEVDGKEAEIERRQKEARDQEERIDGAIAAISQTLDQDLDESEWEPAWQDEAQDLRQEAQREIARKGSVHLQAQRDIFDALDAFYAAKEAMIASMRQAVQDAFQKAQGAYRSLQGAIQKLRATENITDVACAEAEYMATEQLGNSANDTIDQLVQFEKVDPVIPSQLSQIKEGAQSALGTIRGIVGRILEVLQREAGDLVDDAAIIPFIGAYAVEKGVGALPAMIGQYLQASVEALQAGAEGVARAAGTTMRSNERSKEYFYANAKAGHVNAQSICKVLTEFDQQSFPLFGENSGDKWLKEQLVRLLAVGSPAWARQAIAKMQTEASMGHSPRGMIPFGRPAAASAAEEFEGGLGDVD